MIKKASLLPIILFGMLFFSTTVLAQNNTDDEILNALNQRVAEQQKQMLDQSNEIQSTVQIMFVIIIINLIAIIWALIDIVRANNDTKWKLLWCIITVFLGIIGAVLYLFIGRKQKI